MQVRLRHGDVVAQRRDVRRLLRPVRAHQPVRDARRRGRPAPAARRAAVARPAARHGAVRVRDDRHGHLRRPQPGRGVAEPQRRAGGRRHRARARARRGHQGRPTRSACWPASRSSRGFYRLGIDGAHSVGGGLSAERLRRGFIHSLVPIAMVYVAAHYLTFLLFEGQAIGYLASDPLGRGWDLFGTASASIDFGWLSQNAAWYLQVAFVVLGHVAALVLAHDRALVLYGAGAAGRALAVLDARRDGGLHHAGPVAARPGRAWAERGGRRARRRRPLPPPRRGRRSRSRRPR